MKIRLGVRIDDAAAQTGSRTAALEKVIRLGELLKRTWAVRVPGETRCRAEVES